MIPFFLFFYFASFIPYNGVIAFVIFILASLTDTLDGQIARRDNIVTDFGKLMDPLADKLLVMAALVCLLGDSYIIYPLESPQTNTILSIIIMIIVLGRDLVVNSIRLVAASTGIIIAADIFGKLKTVFQMVWISWALLGHAVTIPAVINTPFRIIETALLVAMLFFTIISGFNYVWKNRQMFADA